MIDLIATTYRLQYDAGWEITREPDGACVVSFDGSDLSGDEDEANARLFVEALSNRIKLLIDDNWLQRRVAAEPDDGCCEAGSDTPEPHADHIAETYNEFGTPVSMFRCFHCQTIFTVCPAVEPEKHDQWIGCMADDCASYDEARDGDKLFDAGRVQRVGDRSGFQIVEHGRPAPEATAISSADLIARLAPFRGAIDDRGGGRGA